ncbi:GNAT family N-acetyltransferase [Bosea sp. AS-1]|uniref:GNAT family N-acetyltransferase n=1 Tax=Bosea sp. AS-1 TaxID=2015316 RepID=UPI000B783E38|nr:GNAT family N-acetyltransferase [Bosea sp. AS-1]
MIEILRNDRRRAFAVSAEIYPRESAYVPPMWSDFDRILDPARNPLVTEGHGRFELFTALRDGRPLGRIVATIHDASNARHGMRRAQFGYFDCADDPEVATALLGAAEEWARERGMTEIVGNFNLTAMQQIGMVTEGFERAPYTDMIWSPPHLPLVLEANGYARTFPMTTFEIALGEIDPARLLGPKQHAVLADLDYSWLPIDRSHFAQRLEDSRLILNDGFDANPMFVPPTAGEYRFQAGDMMWVIDKRISTVIQFRGEPVGAIIAIPDLNPLVKAVGGRIGPSFPLRFIWHRWTNKRAVIVYQSVCRAFHDRGINGAMLYKVSRALKAAGYTTLGGTWIADINGPSLRQAEKAGAKPLHKLHLFAKSLAR